MKKASGGGFQSVVVFMGAAWVCAGLRGWNGIMFIIVGPQPRCPARKDPQGNAIRCTRAVTPRGARMGANPPGARRRASPCCVRLVGRCPASALLAFLAWLARRRAR